MEHTHSVPTNTDEVFRTFIGCTVDGLIISGKERTIVFDCGWGLVINHRGSHWTARPEEILEFTESAKIKLENTELELKRILKLAGGASARLSRIQMELNKGGT